LGALRGLAPVEGVAEKPEALERRGETSPFYKNKYNLIIFCFPNNILPMNKIEFLGFEWKNENLIPGINNFNLLTNDQIGKVGFSFYSLDYVRIYSEWKKEDYYKLISLIHEKAVYGKPYLIHGKNDIEAIKKHEQTFNNFTLIEYTNLLDDFPKNIIEIQRRSILMLYKQYPRYGDFIGDTLPYDFFSESYKDWIFVIETMKRKNWIDVGIKKFGDGRFALGQPFIITEDGWLEIEKEIERNFSKQVFVAMWFDKSMDNASKKIEEAIRDCGLEVMRIDRKEHNNEISGEILLEIRNSRIVIADVTGQRNGVYFEAGFALGHKKSVIWACKDSDKGNIHFDTRQYSHVMWENEDDLYTKLKNRIMATLAIEGI